MIQTPDILVIGSSIAALSTAVHAASRGLNVALLSLLPPWQDKSAVLPYGFNAVNECSDDSFETHLRDSLVAGGFLNPQTFLSEMITEAPNHARALARMGVAWDRTDEGHLHYQLSDGCTKSRTLTSGFRTGHAILRALESQVQRFCDEGKISVEYGVEFSNFIVNANDRVCGAIFIDTKTHHVRGVEAKATVLATGNLAEGWFEGGFFNAAAGLAVARAFKKGIALKNPEFFECEPCYFAEPQGLTETRQFFLTNGNRIELDISQTLSGISKQLDCLNREKAQGIAGRSLIAHGEKKELITIRPTHCAGGLFVDGCGETVKNGLYAAGQATGFFHGAGMVSGNLFLSEYHWGFKLAQVLQTDLPSLASEDLPEIVLEDAIRKEVLSNRAIFDRRGSESFRKILTESNKYLRAFFTEPLSSSQIANGKSKIEEWKRRLELAPILDRSAVANRELFAARHFGALLDLFPAILAALEARKESRGVLKRSDCPKEDGFYLKSTKVRLENETILVEYEDLDCSKIAPPALLRGTGKFNAENVINLF